ncbi:MAG: hypothetical protein IT377_07300 [Polyangiaceae bacterium]|nr:hypothetical protein [Polyangiaceae bacterium]
MFGLFIVFFGGRILLRVLRNALARLHALRSIPLPRHSTLVSGKPSGQIEAVFLDVFDTEHRRTFEGEPRYDLYSAEEVAELRVTLFERAFRRKEPRILYEIEVGVPLLRQLEERDPRLSAWVEERLQLHRPIFGKRDTIDDLILKPPRFRWFLWTHGIGASAVLFFEEIFKSLPITIVPRRLAALTAPALQSSVASSDSRATSAAPVARDIDQVRARIATARTGVMKKLETGDEEATRAAISAARAAIEKEIPEPRPPLADDFLRELGTFEERLDTFEDAFAIETSKHMDEWAPWLREALSDASGGGELANLGEEAVLDAFKRRARYRWVTDSGAKATPPIDSTGSAPASITSGQNSESIGEDSGEATDDEPTSSPRSTGQDADKGTEIGF